MKTKLVLLLSLALLFALTGGALRLAQGTALAGTGGNYDVEWHVIGSAGDQFVSGGSYQIGFTLAQDTPPLISSGGSYQIVQGYWAGGSGGE